MDVHPQNHDRRPGPRWSLERAQPESWLVEPRRSGRADARGSAGRLALQGLRKRKLLAPAGIAVAMAPILVWMFLVPAEYHASQPIVFDHTQALADRTKLLATALGPELRQRAAEACGLPVGGISLTATAPDLRTLVLGASHPNRALAVRALEASMQTLRALTPADSRLPSPIDVQPRRFAPLRGLLLLAAAILGCMAAAVVAWRLERRLRPIGGLDELAEMTGLPVLVFNEGTSPHVS